MNEPGRFASLNRAFQCLLLLLLLCFSGESHGAVHMPRGEPQRRGGAAAAVVGRRPRRGAFAGAAAAVGRGRGPRARLSVARHPGVGGGPAEAHAAAHRQSGAADAGRHRQPCRKVRKLGHLVKIESHNARPFVKHLFYFS